MSANHDNRRNRSAQKIRTDWSVCVFWMLLATGLAVLGACIVTPSWLRCQMLGRQELEISRQLEQLRISSSHQAEAIEAAQADVAFNERLLIEELNYHRPGEQALPSVTAARPASVDSEQRTAHKNPAWLEAFTQPDTRNILLFMSAGLVLFAFVYYQPGKRSADRAEIPVRPAPARFVR